MMARVFVDHFRNVTRDYRDHRPSYPTELFEWLSQQCAEQDLAWDCGAGNGQAATSLARYFQHVVATDASAAQIDAAIPHERVSYRLAPAEDSGLERASADLVTVAQALHWFDIERFYAEARKVLRPEGIIAVWCYGVVELEGDEANSLLQHFYHHVVGPYWPAERRHVESGYRELPFPFTAIEAPPFAMQVDWTRSQLLGYLRSWSATARYNTAHGIDPVDEFEQQLGSVWPDSTQARKVSWPLSLRVGRVPVHLGSPLQNSIAR